MFNSTGIAITKQCELGWHARRPDQQSTSRPASRSFQDFGEPASVTYVRYRTDYARDASLVCTDSAPIRWIPDASDTAW